MTKRVSQLDADGFLVGSAVADESPLEPGVFLIPGGCVDAAAPIVPEGQRARWDNGWVFVEIPQPAPEPERSPTEEEIIAAFTAEIQFRLDSFARTRNYDGILSACTYATSTVPKFAAEGQYAVQARDATWAAAYQILADVQAGTRPMPSQPSDIFPELPELVWPV